MQTSFFIHKHPMKSSVMLFIHHEKLSFYPLDANASLECIIDKKTRTYIQFTVKSSLLIRN